VNRRIPFYIKTRLNLKWTGDNQKKIAMEKENKICQSCGMPMDKDPQGGGTDWDQSKSEKYCSFCFINGKFIDEGITLEEKIEKNIRISVTLMNTPEKKAREMAESILPKLERWK
jgi:hypothetical protein